MGGTKSGRSAVDLNYLQRGGNLRIFTLDELLRVVTKNETLDRLDWKLHELGIKGTELNYMRFIALIDQFNYYNRHCNRCGLPFSTELYSCGNFCSFCILTNVGEIFIGKEIGSISSLQGYRSSTFGGLVCKGNDMFMGYSIGYSLYTNFVRNYKAIMHETDLIKIRELSLDLDYDKIAKSKDHSVENEHPEYYGWEKLLMYQNVASNYYLKDSELNYLKTSDAYRDCPIDLRWELIRKIKNLDFIKMVYYNTELAGIKKLIKKLYSSII